MRTAYYSMLTSSISPVGKRINLEMGHDPPRLLRAECRERGEAPLARVAEQACATRTAEAEAGTETSYAARGRRQAVVRVSAKWMVWIFDGTVFSRYLSPAGTGGGSAESR